jgi:hypothetical protein
VIRLARFKALNRGEEKKRKKQSETYL